MVVQEAIAGGPDVTADVFAEAGEVIGATYRELWKSIAGLSAEGMIGPVPEDVGQVVREVCRALQWDGPGHPDDAPTRGGYGRVQDQHADSGVCRPDAAYRL